MYFRFITFKPSCLCVYDFFFSFQVTELVNLIQSEATRLVGLKMMETDKTQPLPPASFQSFLRHDKTLPGVVIADHNTQYINE